MKHREYYNFEEWCKENLVEIKIDSTFISEQNCLSAEKPKMDMWWFFKDGRIWHWKKEPENE